MTERKAENKHHMLLLSAGQMMHSEGNLSLTCVEEEGEEEKQCS